MCDNPTHHNTIGDLVAMVSAVQETARRSAAIEQAKGIIIGATGVDPEEAFAILVRQSQQQKRNLWALAACMVEDAQTHQHRVSVRAREHPPRRSTDA